MFRFKRRHVASACGLALLAASGAHAARAQTRYPERPIRLILSSGAGGVGDTVIRLLAPAMEKPLGQRLIIEAKPGAAGNIGVLEVARAGTDGYTILVGATSNFVINQFLAKLPLDPLAALTPIAKIAEVPIVFFARPSLPARNLDEFIAHVRANPGKLNYASPGTGSVNHLLVKRLEQVTGIEVTHVPYRTTPAAMQALLINDVQLFPVGLALGAAYLREGRLTALAVTAEWRMPLLPDVPNVIEAGFPDLAISNWWAMAAPRETPEPVIRCLNQAAGDALRDPRVVERFAALGLVVPTLSREQFAASLGPEAELWSRIIRHGNITID